MSSVEENCTVLIACNKSQGSTADDLRALMESNDDKDKMEAIKTLILMLISGEKLASNTMMHVIRYCINTRHKPLKKLLYVYWEIVKKYDFDE